MNGYLSGKVISYLTHDQIIDLYSRFPSSVELKKASDLLIRGRDGFEEACRVGNRFGIHKLIKKNPRWWNMWNEGLRGACQGGHRGLVDLMILNGANNWNKGLSGACGGGYYDLIDLMIQYGATYCCYCFRLCTSE